MGNTKLDPNKITSYPLPLVPPPRARRHARPRSCSHVDGGRRVARPALPPAPGPGPVLKRDRVDIYIYYL